MAITNSIIELFSKGGPVIFVIAGISLVSWFLSLKTWFCSGTILKRIQKINYETYNYLSNNITGQRQHKYTETKPNIFNYEFSNLFNTNNGFLQFGLTNQTNKLGSNIWLVGTLANILPLLGLLGTVLGMLLSFEVIQSFGRSQPQLLAGGIGQALITTQAGIWTAMPVFFFYHIIKRRMRLINNEIEILFHITQQSNGNNNFNIISRSAKYSRGL